MGIAHLGIPSLELCRLHMNLIYCYKIIFGMTCLDTETLFTLNPVCDTRRHANKLYKPRCKSTLRRNFLSKSDQCLELPPQKC